MEKQYNPSIVEDRIYAEWLTKKYFHANENSAKPSYSIVIPPPNVTGILHMGHALNNTIQDILIRFKRMDGYESMWMPGTDHAGIATQNVVEKKLAKEKRNRHQLGREGFVSEVWKWKEEYHATISAQLKKLGSSCDWDRERFTMDEGLSASVRKVFVQLYKEGLVYRGKYIINWCPRCHTALSDEEAEHKELEGGMHHFRYPFADGSGFVVVATTRPETMLGDTAVAVNPKDPRYTALIGKKILLPLVNREIPLIADDFCDKEFGTGAVKVTPAHDPNDFQMGQRHNMTPIVIMDGYAKMCGDIPQKYIGVDRFEARKMIIEDMTALGLVEKIEKHTHSVGHCYRCATVVEPYFSDQWFVRMKPLAEKALTVAQNDEVTFHPQRWKKIYCDWMENIRDWCISRQIWWGHRIPVWYCDECGHVMASETDLTKCEKCGSAKLRQDEDVLDTWFSSWLWPFSTMGWPENTTALQKFYPTNELVTAPEILFFWVARMIMAGLHFTGKLPFTRVLLHGTVRDDSGRKMSKSLGNSVDPLGLIAEHGADALRFSLMMITSQGADVYWGKASCEIGRNFANKLWNASRFLLSNVKEPMRFDSLPSSEVLKAEDRWILSRLNSTIASVRESLDNIRTNDAARTLYEFTWSDFCDWYIEAKKSDFYGEDEAARNAALSICAHVLSNILRLLHPLMPFITEEIWQHLTENISWKGEIEKGTIMFTSFPKADAARIDTAYEERFSMIKEIIVALRTIRSENNVPPDKKGTALIIPVTDDDGKWIKSQAALINSFVRLDKTDVSRDAAKPAFAGQAVVKGHELYISLEGLIDMNKEIERITKEIDRVKGFVASIEKKLSNEAFVAKAPASVIEIEKEKMANQKLNLEKLEQSLAALK